MIKDEIIQILEKNGYVMDDNIRERIDTMLQCLRDENQINHLENIEKWLKRKREECDMRVKEVGLNELDKWNIEEETNNVKHESGGFFEVIGVNVTKTADREVGEKGWSQPIIANNPGGILGLLMKKINGVPHFLIQAKAEPGNIDKIQLSPTLQATTSNLLKAHGGKKPIFAEYFDNPQKENVIYAKWQSEDGGRFYLKSNFNMIVEINADEKLDIPDSFIWMTLFQIKQLIKKENIISPHVRGIISVL